MTEQSIESLLIEAGQEADNIQLLISFIRMKMAEYDNYFDLAEKAENQSAANMFGSVFEDFHVAFHIALDVQRDRGGTDVDETEDTH